MKHFFNNPVIRRYCRSRLRWQRAIFWYLLVLVISSFTSAIIYTIGVKHGDLGSEFAARSTLMPLLGIQGFFVMFLGAGRVSGGIIQDTIDQTIDYQRLTPMKPWQNLLGYLYGLPVREYVLLGITLPHTLFATIVGKIPLGTILSVYLVFFTTTCLYHLIGYASSMTVLKWRWSWLLTLLLVFMLNVFLPILSQTGLVFFNYLTIRPVLFQKLVPLYAEAANLREGMAWDLPSSVPFFNWDLSPMTFTLLVQGGLIATFATMVLRKWKSAENHPLSKAHILVFLVCFITLFLGNLWPLLQGTELPFPIFGQRQLSQLGELVAISLPMVYSIVTWLLCAVLISIATPNMHGFLRGRRRALKLGKQWPGFFNDDLHSIWTGMIVAAIAFAGWYFLYSNSLASGFYDRYIEAGIGQWRLAFALVLMILYFTLLIQVLGIPRTALVMLLLWAVPVLTSILFGAIRDEFSTTASYILCTSPFAWLVVSGLIPASLLMPESSGFSEQSLTSGFTYGAVLIILQIAYLAYRWIKTRNQVSKQTLQERKDILAADNNLVEQQPS